MLAQTNIGTFGECGRILARAGNFIYLLPHPALRDRVSNYTLTFPGGDMLPDNYTVIPHGSSTLVFMCGGGGIEGSLFGPATRPCVVGGQANAFTMLFIVEFQPGGLHALTGVRQSELADRVYPFEQVDRALNRRIMGMLDRAGSVGELLAGMDGLLLSGLHDGMPPELAMATQMIIGQCGNISLKELSGLVHYSERHLGRIFDQYLGMGAKRFSRLVRVNRAVRLLREDQIGVGCVGDRAGFYDAAHFVRDFKAVCGVTPHEYRENMSDFYNEIAKF